MSDPETVVAIYRVRESELDPFMQLLTEHWPTLRRLDLATDEPPTVYRGKEDDGGPIVFEIFTWATAEAPGVSTPAPGPGSGGVRSADEIGMPATSGEVPPSGCPTASPFSVTVSAT